MRAQRKDEADNDVSEWMDREKSEAGQRGRQRGGQHDEGVSKGTARRQRQGQPGDSSSFSFSSSSLRSPSRSSALASIPAWEDREDRKDNATRSKVATRRASSANPTQRRSGGQGGGGKVGGGSPVQTGEWRRCRRAGGRGGKGEDGTLTVHRISLGRRCGVRAGEAVTVHTPRSMRLKSARQVSPTN